MRDLQYRAIRFLLTIVGTGLIFSLVMVMTGLSDEFRGESQDTVDAFGVENWVVADGPEGPFTGAKTIQTSLAGELGVEASPISLGSLRIQNGDETNSRWFVGAEPGGIGVPVITAGRAVEKIGEAVANDEAGLELGGTFKLAARDFKVVGLTSDRTIFGGLDLLFVHIGDLQSIFYSGKPFASAILAAEEPSNLPDGLKLMTPDDVGEDIFGQVKDTSDALETVSWLLWIAATSLMGAVVYLTAMDRLRDFAVIKAHGGSTTSLLGSLIFEAIIVAVIAASAGIVLQRLVEPLFPFSIDPPEGAYVRLAVVSVAAGIVASIGAVRRAARVDPVVAFSAAS